MTTYHRRNPGAPLLQDIEPGDLVSVMGRELAKEQPDRFGPFAFELPPRFITGFSGCDGTYMGIAISVVEEMVDIRKDGRIPVYLEDRERWRWRRTVLVYLETGQLGWFNENQVGFVR